VRWIGFFLAAVAAVIVQISLGAVLRFRLGSGGLCLAVDFLAILAVMIGLRASETAPAILAGWILGLGIDLATTGTPVGLYALTFAMATAVVAQIRPAVFVENPLTQAIVALVFCLLAHGAARTFICLYVQPGSGLGRQWLQALLGGLATAVVAPPVLRALRPLSGLIILQPRRRR